MKYALPLAAAVYLALCGPWALAADAPKLTDPQQADWYAVNTAAQGKHISFATA